MTDIEDITYRKINGFALKARLYHPTGSECGKWVIDVHGGAWNSGDRLKNAIIHKYLASHGIGVFSIDFRLSDEAQYPVPVQDVWYGVCWFKNNQKILGIDATYIGGLGSSSGAQQLGLVALQPNRIDWCTGGLSPDDAGEGLEFFIACWPILDPFARYKMAKAVENHRLIDAHEQYFNNKQDMVLGNPYHILERGEATHLPKMLIIQGTEDANVDHRWQNNFAEIYAKKGGSIVLKKFEGQGHTFITNSPEIHQSREALDDIKKFIFEI
tara:strand:- start:330 stop:1139 length:810 start_codon:yes stop_codon:yes gene_type:complete